MAFMFMTKIIVKMGSNVYRIPTLLSSCQIGSGLAPISTSKNLPEIVIHVYDYYHVLILHLNSNIILSPVIVMAVIGC